MKYIAQFREVPQVNVALPENVGWTVIKVKKEIQDCLAEPVPKVKPGQQCECTEISSIRNLIRDLRRDVDMLISKLHC